jgi:hypothetical protein
MLEKQGYVKSNGVRLPLRNSANADRRLGTLLLPTCSFGDS